MTGLLLQVLSKADPASQARLNNRASCGRDRRGLHDFTKVQDQHDAPTQRRHTIQIAAAQVSYGVTRRLNRSVWNGDELARLVGQQADVPGAVLDDQQPRARVQRRTFEAKARTQVDDRHDLAAREDNAFHKLWRVRYRRDLLDHLHVLDLPARHRVRRAGHTKHDVGLRFRRLGGIPLLGHADALFSVRGRSRTMRPSAATSRMRTNRPSPNSVAPDTPSTRISGSAIDL